MHSESRSPRGIFIEEVFGTYLRTGINNGILFMKSDKSRVDRRTVLRGVGVAMSLPWLESISVWGDESNSAKPENQLPRRFAAMFMGNGINSKHWWAKGSGAEMELSQSLEPLAPLKTKLNCVMLMAKMRVKGAQDCDSDSSGRGRPRIRTQFSSESRWRRHFCSREFGVHSPER